MIDGKYGVVIGVDELTDGGSVGDLAEVIANARRNASDSRAA
jgi:hypothetical protein